MSVSESTSTEVKKASKRSGGRKAKATSEVLAATLDNAEIQYVAWSRLFVGELNCRIIPHTPEELREYADSIHAVGQIHNIVVVECDDGRLEVVCGGGRTKAIGLLVGEGKVDPDHAWIACKAVPRELAKAISLTENGRHKKMHPAEQIAGFGALAEEGKTPAQIGDLLGYSVLHVRRMLKLAGLAPVILEALAADTLSTEHCQVLALEPDPARQVQVYEAACRSAWNHRPEVNTLRNLITDCEVSTLNNARYDFVGRAGFADDEFREDLFSGEQGGYVNRLALDTAVLEQLQRVADSLSDAEGWGWAMGRNDIISRHGEDAQVYRLTDAPEPEMTDAEATRLDELEAEYDENSTATEETDALEAEMNAIRFAAAMRSWTPAQRARLGVVVSWYRGEVYVQRGVHLLTEEEKQVAAAVSVTTMPEEPADPVDEVSQALLTRMSAERTLAVQAALLEQRERAVAVLAWTLSLSALSSGAYPHPADISHRSHHYSLTEQAPSGKEGKAITALMQEKERLLSLLPTGWERDVAAFFTLNGQILMDVLAWCTAASLDGVQSREYSHTPRSPLDGLEVAMEFRLQDWWQPTASGFFSGLKKPQICQILRDNGLTGAASDAEKLKKGDAAVFAEDMMRQHRPEWVPDWMVAKEARSATLPEPTATDTPDADSEAPDAVAVAA